MPGTSWYGWNWAVASRRWAWPGRRGTRWNRRDNLIQTATTPGWSWPGSPVWVPDLASAVPPAFRVNGEIILADEDALTEQEVAAIAAGLLNEQQKKKFDEEWELCISLLHPAAGRVRATFYRRNGHPEMSFRFCGEHIATREELGLPEKIDDLARKPNGLV